MLKPRAHHPVPNDLSALIGALSLSLSLSRTRYRGQYTLNYRQLASATLLAFERSSGRRAENCKLLLHLPAFTSLVAHFQRPARSVRSVFTVSRAHARVCVRACTRALPPSLLPSLLLRSRPFLFSTSPLSLCLPVPLASRADEQTRKSPIYPLRSPPVLLFSSSPLPRSDNRRGVRKAPSSLSIRH